MTPDQAEDCGSFPESDRPRSEPPPGKWRGYSLAEVITATVIVGVLAAVAIPRLAGSITNHRLEAAAARIAADLDRARWRARTTSTSQAVQFAVAANRYSLPTVTDINHPGQVYFVELSEVPYQVTLVSADFGGDTEIIFDGYGVPDSGGTVVVRVGDRQKVIAVDAETGLAMVSEQAVGGGDSDTFPGPPEPEPSVIIE